MHWSDSFRGFSSSEELLSLSSQTQVPSRSSLRSLADLLHQTGSPLADKKLVCLSARAAERY